MALFPSLVSISQSDRSIGAGSTMVLFKRVLSLVKIYRVINAGKQTSSPDWISSIRRQNVHSNPQDRESASCTRKEQEISGI